MGVSLGLEGWPVSHSSTICFRKKIPQLKSGCGKKNWFCSLKNIRESYVNHLTCRYLGVDLSDNVPFILVRLSGEIPQDISAIRSRISPLV